MNELVWADEFDGDGFPDPTRWTSEIQNPGWVNNEKQHYVKDLTNCRVEQGKLILEAHCFPDSKKKYTSCRLKSQFKGDWLYGRIEVKAKLPRGRGTWPAIWAMPTDSKYGVWPNSGEIDIMEHVGHDPGWVHGSVHCKDYYWKINTEKSQKIHVTSACDEFHIYFLDWREDHIDIGVDGQIYFTYKRAQNYNSKNWPFDQKFYLILNIAIGGGWGGEKGIDDSAFPQRMIVDYVRVYS